MGDGLKAMTEREKKTLSWIVCPSCDEKKCFKVENCEHIAEYAKKLEQQAETLKKMTKGNEK